MSNFQYAKSSVYKEMWATMVRNAKHDTDVLSTNHTVHMLKIVREQYAYISDVTGIQAEMALNCHITMLDVRFMPMHYSVGFQNNSAYKNLVDEQYVDLRETLRLCKRKMYAHHILTICLCQLFSHIMSISFCDYLPLFLDVLQ